MICPDCQGKGAITLLHTRKCERCAGTGEVRDLAPGVVPSPPEIDDSLRDGDEPLCTRDMTLQTPPQGTIVVKDCQCRNGQTLDYFAGLEPEIRNAGPRGGGPYEELDAFTRGIREAINRGGEQFGRAALTEKEKAEIAEQIEEIADEVAADYGKLHLPSPPGCVHPSVVKDMVRRALHKRCLRVPVSPRLPL
ncbi:MAG TPA: hypothetical protein VK797_22835 [Tepidisphaeraceae bacterium]|jgi:hypothetical protein|nr:hypothetical protein [Tepidisphaeraceae bacterium]